MSSRASLCGRTTRCADAANAITSRLSPGRKADPRIAIRGLGSDGMPLELLKAGARDTEDQEYLWTLNFGPQHPATHTTLRLILTLDGETVVKAVPDIGFLHSGFEKLGEDLDYNQYVTIVDRMNYISPFANEVSWHHTVEKLLGIEITLRCKYLRTMFAELARISDHLLCVGAAALDLGAFTAFLYALYQREQIY